MHIHTVLASTNEWNVLRGEQYAVKVMSWGGEQFRLNAFANGGQFGASVCRVTREDVETVTSRDQVSSMTEAQILADALFEEHYTAVGTNTRVGFDMSCGADDETTRRAPATALVAG